MKILQLLLNGNPLKSITLTSILAVIGAYLTAHFDPSALTPLGATVYSIITGILGVVLHHAGTPPKTN